MTRVPRKLFDFKSTFAIYDQGKKFYTKVVRELRLPNPLKHAF